MNFSIVEGQEYLADALTAFNKVASENFKTLMLQQRKEMLILQWVMEM